MMPLSFRQLADYAGGELVAGNLERCAHVVGTDSRAIQPGSLFVALRGEKYDAHDFVQGAVEAGAVAVMVEKDVEIKDKEVGVIRVGDTLKGLQRLAGAYRASLKVRVVGVTGSVGKSSTKEMIASVLSQKFNTHKSLGNQNNHIGVPLTLLGIEAEHEWAVVEMGMNHPGELEPLVALARPEVGVVTNVGWTHVWAFEDQDGIAREKSVLMRMLPRSGMAIINADDERTHGMVEVSGARSIFVGEGKDWAYGFENVKVFEEGVEFDLYVRGKMLEMKLNVPAPHMVRNAAFAAAIGGELGLTLDEIASGLAEAQIPPNRCAVQKWHEGWLVDDTYNASPDSMLAGFDMVKSLVGKGRCVALLGAMGELGGYSKRLHEMVGTAAVEKGIQLLFAMGEDSRFMVKAAQKAGLDAKHSRWFPDHEKLAAAYKRSAQQGDRILAKGSRSQKMERVVKLLQENCKSKKGGVTCCST